MAGVQYNKDGSMTINLNDDYTLPEELIGNPTEDEEDDN